MSSDGIYIATILPLPYYLVAYCLSISNINRGDKESQDYYRWQLFKDAKMFSSQVDASTYANQLKHRFGMEHNVVVLEHWDRPLNPDAKNPCLKEKQESSEEEYEPYTFMVPIVVDARNQDEAWTNLLGILKNCRQWNFKTICDMTSNSELKP